ncbi:G-type lectin S-receptor-like serine/threonine-protein kinase At4g27290, partial [Olea europaea var. sylvestris]|uniref:G-type lectin S-receptor-like serine/threonine-protein kinase At4g27290 n=1 Tax=Olea europaea var. sylvestris TaxID=158386 RepID=UPI000C1D2E85
MKKSTKDMSFIIVLLFLLSISKISTAIDTINTTQILRDGDTLVSYGGVFELGFFSPGNSRNRYVGIWYKKIPGNTVVWVANKETPLTSVSGILKVIEPGNLVLREARDDNPENFLWQSFEYLSDTTLPSTKFGLNYVTGRESFLTSWKTNEDPSPGNFTFHLDTTGYPQGIIKRGNLIVCRIGPWNGIRLSGIPNARQDPTYAYGLFMSKNRTYYWEEAIDKSVISRVTLSQSGVVQRMTWVDRIQDWVVYLNIPADICDTYKLCGAYGRCNIGNSPSCGCLDKFVPKDAQDWIRSDWSNGCIRRNTLS